MYRCGCAVTQTVARHPREDKTLHSRHAETATRTLQRSMIRVAMQMDAGSVRCAAAITCCVFSSTSMRVAMRRIDTATHALRSGLCDQRNRKKNWNMAKISPSISAARHAARWTTRTTGNQSSAAVARIAMPSIATTRQPESKRRRAIGCGRRHRRWRHAVNGIRSQAQPVAAMDIAHVS